MLGIGINIAVPEEGFPEEIRSIAGAIFDGPCPVEMRSRISAAVISRFFALYKNLGSNLLVRLDSGEERAFSAGEVQIHKGFANPKAE